MELHDRVFAALKAAIDEIREQKRSIGFRAHTLEVIEQGESAIAAVEQDMDDEVQAARHAMREQNMLLVELAASQYLGRQLRSVLQRIAEQAGGCYAELAAVALAIPQDASALEALITRAGEVMRERAANCIANTDWLFANAYNPKAACYNINYQARALQENNIRALPGVTLEDLQK